MTKTKLITIHPQSKNLKGVKIRLKRDKEVSKKSYEKEVFKYYVSVFGGGGKSEAKC